MSKLGSRLGSKLGPEARSILAAGRAGDDPTPADRARVKRALMRSIAASAVAASATTTTTASATAQGSVAAAKGASLGLGLKVLGGAALALAVGTGVLMERASSPDKGSVEAVASSVAAPYPQPFPPTSGEREEINNPLEAKSAAPLSPQMGGKGLGDRGPEKKHDPPKTPLKEPEADNPLPPPAEDPLVAETRRLREAHGALKSGDPQKALILLDEQGGQLDEERGAARILALCQLGRAAEADAARAAFLRDHPRSPLADRIRGGCAPSTPK